MKETVTHKMAFEYYYSLGAGRRLNEVAKKYNVTPATITRWAKDLDWAEKVVERDEETIKLIRDNIDENVVAQFKEYRSIIKASVAEYLKRLKKGEIVINTVSDLIKLIRMDLELSGCLYNNLFNKDKQEENTDKQEDLSKETVNTINMLEQCLNNGGDA